MTSMSVAAQQKSFAENIPSGTGGDAFFQSALKRLDKAGGILHLEPEVYERLAHPESSLSVNFPVPMDNGRVDYFNGFVTHYSKARGPVKGGGRFAPTVDYGEVKTLGFLMTIKNAVAGIPYGGGKMGVNCDPSKLSEREYEALIRRFTEEIADMLGEDKYIPAGDMNFGSKQIGWMLDQYSRNIGRFIPGAVTGKPLSLQGSQGREEATGYGLAAVMRESAKILNMNLAGATVAVQGFGNVGSYAAQFLHESGMKIVAVSDISGGIYNPKGFDIIDVMEWKNQKKNLMDYPKAEKSITNAELLELPVDILVPAASENQITADNAANVKAKVVLEGANGPTTPEADEILNRRGITVIPDVLANAGGVVTSYFEWVQNREHMSWSKEEVNVRLEEYMGKATHDVFDKAKELGLEDLRTGAWVLGVSRVAEAIKARGFG